MVYEYRRATWDEVCELGPQGWRLLPVPPFAEVKQGLAGPQMGELVYTMEREAAPGRGFGASPDGLSDAMVRAGELRMAGMSHLGSLGVAADEMCRDGEQP